ncbi:MAG: hypothetical protein H6598_03095 [Flavobacteriales bacterium]|nr:hypothetical protein [Flavobacteriales bacterium]
MRQNYPELLKLSDYFERRKIQFKIIDSTDLNFFPVRFTINDQSWEIFIDDEYRDFDLNKPLACLYLTLLALDIYNSSDDYLCWCSQYGLNASELKWLTYFQSLETTIVEIKNVLGEVDPCISDYDYTLRTGVVQELLNFRL